MSIINPNQDPTQSGDRPGRVKRAATYLGLTAAGLLGFGEVIDQTAVDATGREVVIAENGTQAVLGVEGIGDVHFDAAKTLILNKQPEGMPDGQFIVPESVKSGDNPLRPYDRSEWSGIDDQNQKAVDDTTS